MCPRCEQIQRTMKGGFGLCMSNAMLSVAKTPGYDIYGFDHGPPRVSFYSVLYQRELLNLNLHLYTSELSKNCISGDVWALHELLQTGLDAPLNGADSVFMIGYLSQVILGAQHSSRKQSTPAHHKEVIQLLCYVGCPVDHGDILGNTALFHAISHIGLPAKLDLAKTLLQNGANVNHRNRMGVTPLLDIVISHNCNLEGRAKFLLENGAEINIPDNNGTTVEGIYRECAPKVVSVFENWKRERAGVEAPLQGRRCAKCKRENVKLRFCSQCGLARYCSQLCQAKHWKEHEALCVSSERQQVVIVKPHYDNFALAMIRGSEVPQGRCRPESVKVGASRCYCHMDPNRVTRPKNVVISRTKMILKVRKYDIGKRSCLRVSNKHRTFSCAILEDDAPVQYAQVEEVIRTKGTPLTPGGPGMRAYFLADLDNPDELKIKLGQVLADQPF